MATLTTAIACVLMFIQMMIDIPRARNETMEYLERVENGGERPMVVRLQCTVCIIFQKKFYLTSALGDKVSDSAA